MSKMSADEFKERREGKTEETFQAENLSAKNFLLNRTRELIKVPIDGPDGQMEIEIRARLTKGEIKEHREFLNMFQNPEDIDEKEADLVSAKFLAAITIDKDLDEVFWQSDDLDSSIMQELIMAFLEKMTSTVKGVQKFRK